MGCQPSSQHVDVEDPDKMKPPEVSQVHASSLSEIPPQEDIRKFFESAVSSKHKAHGPQWSGKLSFENLVAAQQNLTSTVLGEDELKRVFELIAGAKDNAVDLKAFIAAVSDGGASLILRGMIAQFVAGHQYGFKVPESYDFSKATPDNYKADHYDFFGQYADIRQTRDYGFFHVNYVQERQAWQDEAIQSVLSQVVLTEAEVEAPWIVFTAGPMGVGKGYALSWMSKHGWFPLENVVHLDYDGFKLIMPEWSEYVKRDPDSAGTMCHKESSFMMEIAQAAAMRDRRNIWIDGSLRNPMYWAGVFEDVHAKFPHYRIAIFYVEAEEETIRARVAERAEKTGRNVPESILSASLSAMDHSLNMLTPMCDFIARVNNDGPVPVLKAVETVDSSGAWNIIRDRFANPRDKIGDFPQSLRSLPIAPMPYQHFDLFKLETNGLTLKLPDKSDDELVMKLVAQIPGTAVLDTSPEFEIHMDHFARSLGAIPDTATKCCCVYPYVGEITKTPRSKTGQSSPEKSGRQSILPSLGFSEEEQNEPLLELIFEGGFVYLGKDGELLAVNAFAKHKSANVVQFGAMNTVPAAALAKIPEARFHKVTRTHLWERGARSYAFMLPEERVEGINMGGKNGAFVYRVNGHEDAFRFKIIMHD